MEQKARKNNETEKLERIRVNQVREKGTQRNQQANNAILAEF